MKKKLISSDELIEDLKSVIVKLKKQDPTADISRDYYRAHAKYTEKDVAKVFSSFSDFKNALYRKEGNTYDVDKKLFSLMEENKELKKDKDNLIKNSINTDNLLDLYKENLVSKKTYPISNIKLNDSKNKCAILVISDLHLGEVITAEDVNGVNEFNKDICIKRLNEIFYKFELICKKNNVFKCHIFFNGDLVNGGIHEENTRNSDLNEVESIFYLQEYIIMKLSELSKTFNKINCDFMVGNHGRVLQKKPYFKEKVSMNYEYILGMQIKLYFDLLNKQEKNSKIFITVPKSAFIVRNVNTNRFLVSHGDIFAGGGGGGFGGLPFYSLLMNSAKFYGILHQLGASEEVHFDNIILSHFHTVFKLPIFNGGYCYGNGCVNGTNEFSMMKMRSLAKQEQTMFILNDDGMITHEMYLKFK